MSNVPEHLWRFVTPEARKSLAQRFGLPNHIGMQDWEWEVADSQRINEFLSAYKSGELTDDERFALMETLLESFEELESDLNQDSRLQQVLELLDQNVALHIHTLWYWSSLNSELENAFHITPFLRPILERHRARFA